jgi:hypothetical protein
MADPEWNGSVTSISEYRNDSDVIFSSGGWESLAILFALAKESNTPQETPRLISN